MSNGALCATSTAPRRELEEAQAAPSTTGGAVLTIESVMPVSTCTNGLIDMPGCTSVWNSPSTSPPRTFTAPTSVIASEAAAPPVVSRSTTTNVVARRGSSSSSKLDCTNGAGAAMSGTLGLPSDKTVAARAAVPIVAP